MNADFLLELLSEEIPARMQSRARDDLSRMMADALSGAGLSHDGITTYSTPRRLALIARGLPASTAAVSDEIKGPKTSAPPQALDGFLRKTGLTQDQLQDREGTWFATIDKPGQATGEVLAETVATIVRDFAWPKSMRWGAASASSSAMRWVRPLHSIVALFGEEIVAVDIDGVTCGAATLGHRFHHPGPITIGGASDYVEKLRACHVLVDQAEREAIIRTSAAELADTAGYVLVADEGLVVENSGLTEWPVPLLGSFDPDFLDVPEEVIQLTARLNQKYFVARDPMTGRLAPHFICTANIDANDGGEAIVAGNERVLAARLSDARFFWQQDLKVPLEEQAKKLSQIVFHEKLGTVADKVERVAKLARWLVEEGIVGSSLPRGGGEGDRSSETAAEGAPPSAADAAATSPSLRDREELAALAERAARLAKADLVTGMVGEFPELQGVIGGHLARAQGEPDAVADAIRDHYKPVGQGDDVPTTPVTVAVSLADKLDTVAGFFIEEMPPSGSRDPFALRRAALGIISTIIQNQLDFPLLLASFVAGSNVAFRRQKSPIARVMPTIDEIARLKATLGWKQIFDPLIEAATAQANQDAMSFTIRAKATAIDLLEFFADRLKVQQREAGVRHDLIDAVFALGGEDELVRLLARVKALQAFVETGEGANLLAGYKRAANILKKEKWQEDRHPELVSGSISDPQQTSQEWMLKQVQHGRLVADEQALMRALDEAAPQAAAAIAAEDFTTAMTALASLRAPIDAFFEGVKVNDDDPAIRARRLTLLARFRDAVHSVADFSKIEG